MWTILAEEQVFSAEPFVSVSRQHVVTDSGADVRDYYQVRLDDFVVGCALTRDGRVLTLWQYRHGARRSGLTFPAGSIHDETPEAAMRRELLEETGHRAGAIRFLGRCAVTGNQGCGTGHFFLLSDCEPVAAPDSGDLERVEIRAMTIGEIDAALLAGTLPVMTDVALWALARPHLDAR
jgi:8-oxo-dGTP pyrophosphatase MutT (NUDIX family)